MWQNNQSMGASKGHDFGNDADEWVQDEDYDDEDDDDEISDEDEED